jgi:hypothetical protein
LQQAEETSRNNNSENERKEVEKLSQFLKTFSFTIVQNYIDTRIEMASSSVQDDDEELDGGMKDIVSVLYWWWSLALTDMNSCTSSLK